MNLWGLLLRDLAVIAQRRHGSREVSADVGVIRDARRLLQLVVGRRTHVCDIRCAHSDGRNRVALDPTNVVINAFCNFLMVCNITCRIVIQVSFSGPRKSLNNFILIVFSPIKHIFIQKCSELLVFLLHFFYHDLEALFLVIYLVAPQSFLFKIDILLLHIHLLLLKQMSQFLVLQNGFIKLFSECVPLGLQ